MKTIKTSKIILGIISLLCLLPSPIHAGGSDNVVLPLPSNYYRLYVIDKNPMLFGMATIDSITGRGTITMTDARENKQLWAINVDYSTTAINTCTQGLLITTSAALTSRSVTQLLDATTGKKMWKINTLPCYISNDLGILIGYPNNDSPTLKGYNISTGRELWQAQVPHNAGETWNNVTIIDNRHLLFTAKDICLLDITTGELKTQEAKTATNEVLSDAYVGGQAVVSPEPITFLTGSFGSVCSNFIINGDNYYVSDRNFLYSFKKDLSVQWATELPHKSTGKAKLTLKGDTIYMLNTGYAERSSLRTMVGTPYYAAFSKDNGRQLSLQPLPEKWDVERYGGILNFVDDTLYNFNPIDSVMTPIVGDGKSYPVWNDRANIDMLDHNLHLQQRYYGMNNYGMIDRNPRYFVIGRFAPEGELYIVNKDGRMWRRLQNGIYDLFHVENKMYIVTKNALMILDY